jgi:hypothetical protein
MTSTSPSLSNRICSAALLFLCIYDQCSAALLFLCAYDLTETIFPLSVIFLQNNNNLFIYLFLVSFLFFFLNNVLHHSQTFSNPFATRDDDDQVETEEVLELIWLLYSRVIWVIVASWLFMLQGLLGLLVLFVLFDLFNA